MVQFDFIKDDKYQNIDFVLVDNEKIDITLCYYFDFILDDDIIKIVVDNFQDIDFVLDLTLSGYDDSPEYYDIIDCRPFITTEDVCDIITEDGCFLTYK